LFTKRRFQTKPAWDHGRWANQSTVFLDPLPPFAITEKSGATS